MANDGRFYVYAHFRASNGEIFYVGKGTKNRAYSFSDRSTLWKRIHHKHGTIVKIIARFHNEACAYSIEKALIAAHGDSRLANLTPGGVGCTAHAPETCAKISAAKKGKKGPVKSKETRKKLSKANSKKVYSSSGEEFDSGKDAEKYLRSIGYKTASRSNISLCALGHQRTAYDRTWSFFKEAICEFEKAKLEARNVKSKKVIRSDGEVFFSASDAARQMSETMTSKASQGNISMVCRGERSKAYGFGWKYDET